MAHSLRQFEVFLAVARAKSFRRAADGLHLSQPSLSQHVAELERELGVKMFDRLRRTVELTEAGRVLEDHLQRLFATLDSARKAIDDLSGLQRGSLVVGASTTPGIYVVPGMLAGFRARTRASSACRSQLGRDRAACSDREVDLGVVGGHALRPGEACVAAGLLDELVLILPGTGGRGGARCGPSAGAGAASDSGRGLGDPGADGALAPAGRRPVHRGHGAVAHGGHQGGGRGRTGGGVCLRARRAPRDQGQAARRRATQGGPPASALPRDSQ